MYRTGRRNLHNARTSFVFSVVDGSSQIASWGVMERLKFNLGQNGGYLHEVLKFNAFMDQNGDAANLLFAKKTIDALKEQVQSKALPEGHATVLFLLLVYHIIEPIQDPNFGDPFQCVESMWCGLTIARLWRSYVRTCREINLDLNFISLEMYNTLEVLVHGATNHFLAVKRHVSVRAAAKTPDPPPEKWERGALPWRLAGPTRNVSDTRPMEAHFGGMRVGDTAKRNSVNMTLVEFVEGSRPRPHFF